MTRSNKSPIPGWIVALAASLCPTPMDRCLGDRPESILPLLQTAQTVVRKWLRGGSPEPRSRDIVLFEMFCGVGRLADSVEEQGGNVVRYDRLGMGIDTSTQPPNQTHHWENLKPALSFPLDRCVGAPSLCMKTCLHSRLRGLDLSF